MVDDLVYLGINQNPLNWTPEKDGLYGTLVCEGHCSKIPQIGWIQHGNAFSYSSEV